MSEMRVRVLGSSHGQGGKIIRGKVKIGQEVVLRLKGKVEIGVVVRTRGYTGMDVRYGDTAVVLKGGKGRGAIISKGLGEEIRALSSSQY